MIKFVFTLIILLLPVTGIAKDTSNGTAKSSGPGVSPTAFNDETMRYVEANVLATFYHELGHALIDKLRLPIYAREEDAADYFAVVLTEYLHRPEKSELIAWATADQYLQLDQKYKNYEPWYAGVHSLDLVRFYNTICLYYGGDVDVRDDFAHENGLPEYRMETCEEERDMAQRAWMGVIESIERKERGPDWLVIEEYASSNNQYILASHKVIEGAVNMLNTHFSLKTKVSVRMTECNEDNAFYEPHGSKILMCNELVPPLSRRIDTILAPDANR